MIDCCLPLPMLPNVDIFVAGDIDLWAIMLKRKKFAQTFILYNENNIFDRSASTKQNIKGKIEEKCE